MNLEGKTIVVTGGASGIGRALVLEALARGAAVAVADRDLEGAKETLSKAEEKGLLRTKCTVHALDVSSVEQWQALKLAVLAEHGTVDGLINNAGITFGGPVLDTSYDAFDAVMSVNFRGVLIGCKEWLPYLLERPEAFIVNVSSLFGLIPMKSQGAYCASKHAVRGFTEVLAQELKDTSVSVSGVYPGHIGTRIVENALNSGNVVNETASEEAKQVYAKAFRQTGMRPRQAARIIVDGAVRGERRILVGRDAKRGDLWGRLFPIGFANKINDSAVTVQ